MAPGDVAAGDVDGAAVLLAFDNAEVIAASIVATVGESLTEPTRLPATNTVGVPETPALDALSVTATTNCAC